MNDLGFSELVGKEFDFLTRDHDFRLASERAGIVVFENGLVFVSVQYDHNRSYEVSVTIGSLSKRDSDFQQEFNLWELVPLEGDSSVTKTRLLQATDPPGLHFCLSELATQLSEHGQDFLSGDDEHLFERLARERNERCSAAERDKQVQNARRQAKQAWNSSDFKGVVTALGGLENDLQESDKQRLHIARRRLGEIEKRD